MTESINLNTNGLFNLQNDVRITSNNIFNAQDAFENSFEDILLEEVSKEQQETQKTINEIKFANLGMPSGFNLDTSLLEEIEKGTQDNSDSNSYQQKMRDSAYLIAENLLD